MLEFANASVFCSPLPSRVALALRQAAAAGKLQNREFRAQVDDIRRPLYCAARFCGLWSELSKQQVSYVLGTYDGFRMSIATLFVFVILIAAARALYLQVWLKGSVCLRSRRKGWIDIELRRRVIMERLPRHVSEFPVPREQRMLVGRLFGLVLWHREVCVALPNNACEHLSEITPQEFDRQFPNWLRLANDAA